MEDDFVSYQDQRLPLRGTRHFQTRVVGGGLCSRCKVTNMLTIYDKPQEPLMCVSCNHQNILANKHFLCRKCVLQLRKCALCVSSFVPSSESVEEDEIFGRLNEDVLAIYANLSNNDKEIVTRVAQLLWQSGRFDTNQDLCDYLKERLVPLMSENV